MAKSSNKENNLVDKFAKVNERDALWPGFRTVQEEVGRLRGRNPPTIGFESTRSGTESVENTNARGSC